jgi:DNA modification methylase
MEVNKIYNIDCLEGMKQMKENSVDCIVTSPPYYNFQRKHERKEKRHYDMDYGEVLFVVLDACEQMYRVLKEDGLFFLNFGWSYSEGGPLRPFRLIERLQKMKFECVDIIIWHKTNPQPMKNRMTNSFEYIFVLAKNNKWKYNIEEGCYHNVWKFPIRMQNQWKTKSHGAMFPEILPQKCIEISTKEGDLVLDPFTGSGTTLWVAKKLKRKFIGFEINPEYVKLSKERLEQEVFA